MSIAALASIAGDMSGMFGGGLDGALGGGGGEMSSASASTHTVFESGDMGKRDWQDYLPFVLLAVIVLVMAKRG